jgi:hypothetical protein
LLFSFTTRKFVNTNGNIDEIFLSVYCSDIYRPNFPLLNLSVNTERNIPTVHTEGIVVGEEGIQKKKKIQTVQWHVSFTDEVTNEINPTVKFIREYVDGKLMSVYINNIMKGITVRLKKENRTVTWHFYQQNCRWRYHWNNFIGPSIVNI